MQEGGKKNHFPTSGVQVSISIARRFRNGWSLIFKTTVVLFQKKQSPNHERKRKQSIVKKKRQRGSPAVRDGDNAGTVLGNLEEHRHGEVEVRTRRVAPPAIVTGLRVVWRTKVSGCDQDRGATRMAPLWVISALDLEASPTAKPIVEQSSAQSSRVHSVPLAVQVSIPTSPSCRERTKKKKEKIII